jgi:hypothetical protein
LTLLFLSAELDQGRREDSDTIRIHWLGRAGSDEHFYLSDLVLKAQTKPAVLPRPMWAEPPSFVE